MSKISVEVSLTLMSNDGPSLSLAVESHFSSIFRCKLIRKLVGVTHPMNLVPIDEYRCVVLCRRELRVYDLDQVRRYAEESELFVLPFSYRRKLTTAYLKNRLTHYRKIICSLTCTYKYLCCNT